MTNRDMKTKPIKNSPVIYSLALLLVALPLMAADLPRLPKEITPQKLGYKEQAQLPKLEEPYVSPDNKIDFISGVGAGGQYMSIFPNLNLVAVATADNKKEIKLPLDAMLEHLIPLFMNN